MYKIGLIVFAEGRVREDVYQKRKPVLKREVGRVIEALKNDVELFMPTPSEVRDKNDLKLAIRDAETNGADAFLFYVPGFLQASVVTMGVRLANLPCALLGNMATDSFSQVGFLAAAGAIEQAGLSYKRIAGDIERPGVKEELLCFYRAACVEKRLAGKTYGMFGGRSLGIATGTADPAQWIQLFGVDIEQIDQLALVKRAEEIPIEKVTIYMEWVQKNYGAVCFKEGRFDKNSLERMVRSYLAVKELIDLYQLDFVGIKCQPELSNGYVLQCLTVQLLNDPYDADGPKKAVPCSCEADADGALTMQILNLLSDGKPTALQDVYYYDADKLILANCGSSASYFAKHSSNYTENLKEVYLQPHDFGEAGGAATQFTFAPGTYTFARLTRKDRKYRMAIFLGEVAAMTREELSDYCWYRPTSVIKASLDTDCFAKYFACNHVHCVVGNYIQELIEFCRIKGFDYILMNK
jgi:L-fucose isomerase